MRGLALVAALCVALLGAAAFPAGWLGHAAVSQNGKQVSTYRNPVFARDFPDPSVLKVGADYYAYATTTGWESYDHLSPVLRSRDLAHWSYAGDAMTSSPAWGVGDWWAPDVIAAKGVYYMYYVGKDLSSGLHCVAVATASKPAGPFTHRNVIGCGDASGHGYIDPAPLIGPKVAKAEISAKYHHVRRRDPTVSVAAYLIGTSHTD